MSLSIGQGEETSEMREEDTKGEGMIYLVEPAMVKNHIKCVVKALF